MKSRWFVIGLCFVMFLGDFYLLLQGEPLYGQLAGLWALGGMMVWIICKVLDEIIDYIGGYYDE